MSFSQEVLVLEFEPRQSVRLTYSASQLPQRHAHVQGGWLLALSPQAHITDGETKVQSKDMGVHSHAGAGGEPGFSSHSFFMPLENATHKGTSGGPSGPHYECVRHPAASDCPQPLSLAVYTPRFCFAHCLQLGKQESGPCHPKPHLEDLLSYRDTCPCPPFSSSYPLLHVDQKHCPCLPPRVGDGQIPGPWLDQACWSQIAHTYKAND